MLNPTQFGFNATEASQLGAGPQHPEAGLAVLESYGGALAPADTCRLMVRHIHASLDLGLVEHARKLFAGLCELLDDHPELIGLPATLGRAGEAAAAGATVGAVSHAAYPRRH